MTESSERYLARSIATLSHSDPLIKLLREVRMGRMQATDAGLRAVTESWMGTYRRVIEEGDALDLDGLRRLDPVPRLTVLIEAGVLAADQPAVAGLRAAYEHATAKRGG